MNGFTRIRLLGAFVGLVSILLTACGGGGGGSSVAVPPPVPPPSPPSTATLSWAPVSVKTFSFSWQDVSDATHYRVLENPDNSSGFTQVGGDINPGQQAFEHVVPLYARLNAQYILQSCNAAGCTDSATVSVTGSLVEAIGYLKASNSEGDDSFGIAISLSVDGNTLAVGASGEASNATGIDGNQGDNTAGHAGAVYVFSRTDNVWSQQAYVKASNSEAGDVFGRAVHLSADGNTLAVGALGEASNASGIDGIQGDNSASFAGAVYVFSRTGSVWSQQAYVKASNSENSDLFGAAVSLSAGGDTLAVGAPGEEGNDVGIDGNQFDNSATRAGAVYVFSRAGSVWSQQAYVKTSNSEVSDFFGETLSLSADGNTLAVGASGEASNATGIDGNQDDNTAALAGAVYVFSRTGGAWSQQAYVKASNSGADDFFGDVVSLSADGNTLAVGAFGEDGNAIGIDGNQGDNTADSAGAVYVFSRTGGAWSQEAYVKASNSEAGDFFGRAVSLSTEGNALAIGAWSEDSNATGIDGNQFDNTANDAGAVYMFGRAGGTWSQRAYLKASNTEAGDVYGSLGISLSADGNTLAVGAFGEASNATGIDGNQGDNSAADAGAVYLY